MPQASLFLDLDSVTVTPEEAELLSNPLMGGVILFARNTQSAEQVAALVRQIRSIKPDAVISIDQEGGRVQRLKNGVTVLPAVGALESLLEADPKVAKQSATQLGYLMASELISLGVDLSFAPVLDVNYGRNTVIGDRAFGSSPEYVTALSAAYIEGMKLAGMRVTGKHFPGHGWANADTHHHDAVDERNFDEIWATDLMPFREALANQLDAMMFAHVLYPACDSAPAGFSPFWIKNVLREQLSFDGIVFSDDLSMKAAESAGGYIDRAKKALAAGCQALLCCNDRAGTLSILSYLEQANVEPLTISALRASVPEKPDSSLITQAKLTATSLLGQ